MRWCSLSWQRIPQLQTDSSKGLKLLFDGIKTIAYRNATVTVCKPGVKEQKTLKERVGNSSCPPNKDSLLLLWVKEGRRRGKKKQQQKKKRQNSSNPCGSLIPFATFIGSHDVKAQREKLPKEYRRGDGWILSTADSSDYH